MRKQSLFFALMASLAFVVTLWPATAQAQRRRAPARRGAVVFVGGYFYDPFYGPYPWWPPDAYPYRYYPMFDDRAEVRVLVTPKEAAVYIDGYYAGVVDDFDGFFQRLPMTPGPHEIAVYLAGYRTLRQQLYLGPNSTYSLRSTMERLAPGETGEPPTVAPPVPPPPAGTSRLPRTPYAGPTPPPAGTPEATAFGTLAIRVQPSGADVTIDGESWRGSAPGDRLLVHVADGMHHVDITKNGFRKFSADVQVRGGETTPINVSLSPEGTD